MTTELLFKPAAPLNELADRFEKREAFYIGGLAIIDPPLLRLVDRDAIVAALRMNASMLTALKFYADETLWDDANAGEVSTIDEDRGDTARRALAAQNDC